MLKLMNLSTYSYDLERFDFDSQKITDFLEKHYMNGVELLNPIMWEEKILPKKIVKGVHLKYYPTWLDFWNGNRRSLLKQFKSMDAVEKYYEGISRDIMIQHYRKEIETATKIGAEYMVFHVAHVEVEDTYDYKFAYSDAEVVEAGIDLINQVFSGIDTNIKLLFENMWWPGFTMLDKNIAFKLLNRVEYPNKGFMLDTAHLMNTNLYLKDEKEAVEYIINRVEEFGELKNLIKGIHLNCSLSGEYVRSQIKKKNEESEEFDLNPMSEEVFMHVFKIDSHKPFTDNSARKLIEFIKPEYLIYELVASSTGELEEYIETQDRACNFYDI
ncbi:TIM barrel protein [Clostridiaceae bacterium UIB06]|uniref:TIM barrel protein n=1 Tax=Clostridium thailandense TaxID=2794346 RepID=A0A949TLR3_9CLOT|nr:TIM barrel protein [Clostridium thailandense]MBV7275199.1 TIM barrel protein [Clostridium thailandense]MCH5136835.1 TIM barrel protein [Clostridiaceae bacterium UIB06]